MTSINQAAYVAGTTHYEFGHDSIMNMPITNAPEDCNWQRWDMLHDGETYRLFCFKGSSNDTLYQFAWNGSSYEFGHNSIPEITLTNMPEDADASSFAMVHSDYGYHLYLRLLGSPDCLYQFIWEEGTTNYAFGGGSAIPAMYAQGFPADTDWSRWSMLNDGEDYRLFAFKLGSNTEFYQGAWDGSSYAFGHKSIEVLSLQNLQSDNQMASISMLHDGSDYRLYVQTV